MEGKSTSQKLKELFESKDNKSNNNTAKKTNPTKPNFDNNNNFNKNTTNIKINTANYLNTGNQYNGLTNLGNNCYSNVIIQSFLASTDIASKLLKIFSEIENLEQNVIDSEFTVIYNLYKAIIFYLEKNTYGTANHLKVLSSYFDPFCKQNDAHEFMVFILNKAQDEYLKYEKEYRKVNKESQLKNQIDLSKPKNPDNETTDSNHLNNNNNSKENDIDDLIDKKAISEEIIKQKDNNEQKSKLSTSNTNSDKTGKNYNIIINYNNEEEEGNWEEVKKDGKRMKLTNKVNDFNFSPVSELFGGIIKQETIKTGSSLSNSKIEPFYTIEVNPENYYLDKCLDSFFNKKQIEGTLNIFAKTHMEKLPCILILQIKRFYYDKQKKQAFKDTRPIKFDHCLRIKEDWLSPSQRSLKNTEFELTSIIIHQGSKTTEGHYVCYCRESNQQQNNNTKSISSSSNHHHAKDKSTLITSVKQLISIILKII